MQMVSGKVIETTLSEVYKLELVRRIWRYMSHNRNACHAYVMWVELSVSHFKNVVTTGKKGTKMF